jgi:hypothetical protein
VEKILLALVVALAKEYVVAIRAVHVKIDLADVGREAARQRPHFLEKRIRISVNNRFIAKIDNPLDSSVLRHPVCVIFVFPHHNSLQFMNWYIRRR